MRKRHPVLTPVLGAYASIVVAFGVTIGLGALLHGLGHTALIVLASAFAVYAVVAHHFALFVLLSAAFRRWVPAPEDDGLKHARGIIPAAHGDDRV